MPILEKPEGSFLSDPAAFFSARSHLFFPEYEERPSQSAMSRAVQEAIASGQSLIVEAGTGTGKSLAYLLPLLSHARRNNVRVAVSTETKYLQKQLLDKDAPLAGKILESDIAAVICMGAANYICKRRMAATIATGNIDAFMHARLEEFLAWERSSENGNLTEYPGFISSSFRKNIARDPDQCLGRRCPNFPISYFFLEKSRQEDAHLLIMNHSLLAAHMQLDFKLLPEFDVLVIDEAHAFAEKVLQANQGSLSISEIHALLPEVVFLPELEQSIRRLLENRAYLRLIEKPDLPELAALLGAFMDRIKQKENEVDNKSRLLFDEMDASADEDLLDLKKELADLMRAHALLLQFFREPESQVLWFSRSIQQDAEQVAFNSSPLSAARSIKELLLPRLQTIIFTSATLKSSGNDPFAFFRQENGLPPNIKAIALESPFDYSKQALLYLPRNIPDPATEEEGFLQAACALLQHLFTLNGRSVLALFTSRRALQFVQERLDSEITTYSQIDLGALGALDAFRENNNSLLLGLSSFWKGIDLPGALLQTVVIVKLPFKHPDDPVREARLLAEKQAGRNPFLSVQLPETILELRQGFGRLIRTASDRGIVCIIDPRLKTRRYGQQMLDALPDARVVGNFRDLREISSSYVFPNLP